MGTMPFFGAFYYFETALAGGNGHKMKYSLAARATAAGALTLKRKEAFAKQRHGADNGTEPRKHSGCANFTQSQGKANFRSGVSRSRTLAFAGHGGQHDPVPGALVGQGEGGRRQGTKAAGTAAGDLTQVKFPGAAKDAPLFWIGPPAVIQSLALVLAGGIAQTETPSASLAGGVSHAGRSLPSPDKGTHACSRPGRRFSMNCDTSGGQSRRAVPGLFRRFHEKTLAAERRWMYNNKTSISLKKRRIRRCARHDYQLISHAKKEQHTESEKLFCKRGYAV